MHHFGACQLSYVPDLKSAKLTVSLLAFIALSAVQSSAHTRIHSAIQVFHKLYGNANCGIFVFTF